MFTGLRIHGGTATLLWGYRTAATFRTWNIRKEKGEWILTGSLVSVDPFQARQRPLLFTAPRDKGRWCWEVRQIDVGPNHLRAVLGEPLQ